MPPPITITSDLDIGLFKQFDQDKARPASPSIAELIASRVRRPRIIRLILEKFRLRLAATAALRKGDQFSLFNVEMLVLYNDPFVKSGATQGPSLETFGDLRPSEWQYFTHDVPRPSPVIKP
jgi:hypothetical protein